QLDDEVHGGIVDQPVRVGVEAHAGEVHAAVAREVEIGDAHQLERHAEPRADHVRVALQHLHDADADRAEADQADADGRLLHTPASRRNRRMPRTAWRMRWRFSISAKRTEPSPVSPEPTPGDTATCASTSSRLLNSSDPMPRSGSGIGAQT